MKLESRRTVLCLCAGLLAVPGWPAPSGAQQPAPDIAVTGATLIDGTGAAPRENTTILVGDGEIVAVGPDSEVEVPPGARVLEAGGKYVTPGFVNTNVHLSPLSNVPTLARYWDRLKELSLQSAQLELKYGVTTIRDSYGPLRPLMAMRDQIEAGRYVGPRTYVAGNIVGWGGAYSETMRGFEPSETSLFQERVNDIFTEGTGERLINMTPDEVRQAMNEYIDKGPDFIKYGGTTENGPPYLLLFSPRVQRTIVDVAHERGLVAETHATSLEGLRLSILAGLDVVQHPEVVGHRAITGELVQLAVEEDIVCSLLPNLYTGAEWELHREEMEEARRERAESNVDERRVPKTTAEKRREGRPDGLPLGLMRENAEELIDAGCRVSIGSDNVRRTAPEFRREKKRKYREPGIGTIVAMEGLVELGMTPMEVIVAATQNGARASRALDEYGTVEVGKSADLLIMTRDPVENIENVRSLETVIVRGRVVDPDELPTVEVWGPWSGSE